MPGRVFVVAGPSGAGKTTLEKRLMEEVPDLGYSVSATTRPPRAGEAHGRDYFFVSREEFDRMIERGELAEWAEFSGNRYGTPVRFIEAAVAAGQDLLIDVEVQGVESLRRRFPQAVYIAILPPSLAVLKARLASRRTEDEAAVEERFRRAVYEIRRLGQLIREHNQELSPGHDYVIVNDDLEEAFRNLKAVVLSSRLGPREGLAFIDRLLSEAS